MGDGTWAARYNLHNKEGPGVMLLLPLSDVGNAQDPFSPVL